MSSPEFVFISSAGCPKIHDHLFSPVVGKLIAATTAETQTEPHAAGGRLEPSREEKSQVVGGMPERPGGGGARSHANPAIGYTCGVKGYPMRHVDRLVKKRKQNRSKDHRYSAAGGLNQKGQQTSPEE